MKYLSNPPKGQAGAVHVAAIAGIVIFALATAGSIHQSRAAHEYEFTVPQGLPQDLWKEVIPADNPLTEDKVALGQKLFFDKRLSADRTLSCASCHDPATALSDNNRTGLGIRNQKGARRAPTVLNATFNEFQFWDGRAPSLEEQSKMPLINPIEMGMENHAAVVARVREVPEYRPVFAKAFGSQEITIDAIAKAIASFERTQLSGNAPIDRFLAGDRNAISESAKRGWELFNVKARCISCHAFNASSPFFSDFKFHNIGIAAKDQDFHALARRAQQLLTGDPARVQAALDQMALSPGFSELGRYLVTKEPKDIGAFKTPMLRDIELRAPYMHNGEEATLLDVVKFYNDGGQPNPNLDGGMRPLHLNDAEMDDLVSVMKTFTSDDVGRTARQTKPQTRLPFGS
jgi:cytochrome c peroxidase